MTDVERVEQKLLEVGAKCVASMDNDDGTGRGSIEANFWNVNGRGLIVCSYPGDNDSIGLYTLIGINGDPVESDLAFIDRFATKTDEPPPTDALAEAVKAIDMILHCPNCGLQHVDAPEPEICECGHGEGDHPEDFSDPCCGISADGRRCMCREFKVAWLNPPHKSHLCHGCGTVWRPADVPTNGVEAIGTRGEKDTWPIIGKEVV